MRVYRHWARARCDLHGTPDEHGDIVGVGWSDRSEDDARQLALQRARDLAERIRRGEPPPPVNTYYPDRPVREPVLDELRVGDRRLAVLTRNVYGAVVLNTANAMFVDIDRPPLPRVGLIARVLGKPTTEPVDDIPARVEDTTRRNGLGVRLYETAAGYRGLVTSHPFDPTSADAANLLRDFESDSLYVQLCKTQECFRARLTPKPWRCGMPNPPRAFPWTDDDKRRAFDQWSQQYESAITGLGVCRHVATFGDTSVHPDVEPVLNLHDELACRDAARLA